jgi:uncharacterized protein YcbK (DUF882 family)
MKLTRNFDSTEFACPCKKCGGNITLEFARKMQELRDACGFALPISSGYRCSDHNKKIGGAPSSRHMYGTACDISTIGMTGIQILQILEHARHLNFTGFGLASTFIHLDTRPGAIIVWYYASGKFSGDN